MTTSAPYVSLINGTGSTVVHGEIVRVSASNTFSRAQADTQSHLVGLIGVNGSGSIGVTGSAYIFTSGAQIDVLFETGLTPTAGQPAYVSALVAGRATTVNTGIALGVIENTKQYAGTGLVQIALSLVGANINNAGVLTVPNAAALAVLSAGALGDGTRAYIQTFKAYFSLVASTQPLVANVRIAALGNPGRIWLRNTPETGAWWSVNPWYVDPANSSGFSSDENTGDSVVTPLATWGELGRRLRGRQLPGVEINTFVVNLMSDSSLTDYGQFHLDGNMRSSGTISINGTVATAPVGIIASSVTKNVLANQPNTITVTGFNWAPHVGKIIRLVGTPTTTAVVEADLGSNTAQLSEQNVNLIPGAGFTTGQTVELQVGTALGGVTVTGGPFMALQIQDCNFPTGGVFTNEGSFASGITLIRCQSFTGLSVRSRGLGTLYGCGVSGGNVLLLGTLAAYITSFINCPLISIDNPSGFSSNTLFNAAGVVNSYIGLESPSNLVFLSDFHTFNAAAGKCVISCLPFTQCTFLANYYGSGNSPTSAGVGIQFGTSVFYPTSSKPVNDCGKGVCYDAGATGIPIPTTGPTIAYAALPLALTSKMCVMAAI